MTDQLSTKFERKLKQVGLAYLFRSFYVSLGGTLGIRLELNIVLQVMMLRF